MPAAIPCPSCSAPIDHEYCPRCGERRPRSDDLALGKLFQHAIEGLTHLDGKLPRSARLLLSRPGFLTLEFVRGARNRYVRPVPLFLIANAVYFLFQPLTGINTFRTTLALQSRQLHARLAQRLVEAALARRGIAYDEYEARFNAHIDSLSKLLLIALVPLLAAGFALVSIDKRRPFGQHVVFALHVEAFVLAYVCLLFMPFEYRVLAPLLPEGWRSEDVMSSITFVAIAVFLALAFGRVLGDGILRASLRGLLAAFVFAVAVLAYRIALFFVAFWMT